MTAKSERQAARGSMAAYHQEQLGQLLTHVSDALDDSRSGRLDAFEVDRVLFQYSRAAEELWKFCTLDDVEFAASLVYRSSPLTGGSAAPSSSTDHPARASPRVADIRNSACRLRD